jgi:amino acid adenylation domain-containing protein/non-ribosomal peptide synthase protein (TIGR01720 family)
MEKNANSPALNVEKIEGYQLSPQQKRLWLLQRSDRKTAYRIQCAVRIDGNLKQDLLKMALATVIDRSEILRTTFRLFPELTLPAQIINARGDLSIRCSDLRGTGQGGFKWREFYEQMRNAPFDFEKGPLLDLSLFTLSETESVLILGLPALCGDWVSMMNLLRELSASYARHARGEEASGELLQYADLAEWQNELTGSAEGEISRGYWRKQGPFSQADLSLPFERQISEEGEFDPRSVTVAIKPEIVLQIGQLLSRHHWSVAEIFLGCWLVLLRNLTGQSEITIGVACDGRGYAELEEPLGLFARYVPFKCMLSEDVRFGQLLDRVGQTVADLKQWQEGFSWEQLQSLDSTNGAPFFYFNFSFEEQPAISAADGISFSIFDHYVCIDRFKINLSCLKREGALSARFDYDSASVQPWQILRLSQQFLCLLENMIGNLDAEIADIEMLTEIERQQLLIEFNDTDADSPHQCAHHPIEAHAELTPDVIAAIFEEEHLTYSELNTRANRLAWRLKRLGVKPDAPVALFFERSLEVVIGILGVLKAGGAYLPLDPVIPKDRLAYMLADARPLALITQRRLLRELPDHMIPTICLDSDADAILEESGVSPPSQVTPENLVYIIYTSGSTGKPKGVAVEHRQLLNYQLAIQQRLKLAPNASFATVSTFAVDLGNTSTFPSLCTGGSLHILSQERAADIETLVDYFHRHPIDYLKIVPSHLMILPTTPDLKKVLPQRRLILGGEACHWSFIERIREASEGCQILNHYGPTETTVGVLTHAASDGQFDNCSLSLPLGRPLPNIQVYILNADGDPVSIGLPGEAHIGGAGVTRGYLNRPDLTSERFIPDPFREGGGNRLYKTGDLARFLPNGLIEFLGRTDHQVKIRGFRVELREIEAILEEHPTLQRAVVVMRNDAAGENKLVAYVVPLQLPAPSQTELRRYLSEKLPEYMAPAAYVALNSLPLTASGKIDRRALPPPDSDRPQLEVAFAAPRNEVERELAEIWGQVLRLERIGVHDNFFELGGDSILSLQIVARANQRGLRLTPKQLFQQQTIAQLSAVVEVGAEACVGQEEVSGEVALTPIQEWFFEQQKAAPDHWNMAALLEVSGELREEELAEAVKELRRHHDVLRMSYRREGERWVQEIGEWKPEQVVRRIDLSEVGERELEEAIERAAEQEQKSLKLEQGRVMGVRLMELGAGRGQRVLIAIHHLVVDGVSWRILIEDLERGCLKVRRGEKVELGRKTVSYQRWAQMLRREVESGAMEKEREYWEAQEWGEVKRLPEDMESGSNEERSTGVESVELSEEETKVLAQDGVRRYQAGVEDLLLTAVGRAIWKWSGNERVLLTVEGHGREEIVEGVDVSRTVGWFTSQYPVVLEVGRGEVEEDVRRVRERLRGAPRRGVGYGMLRYLSKEGEKLRGAPQPDVCFNYLGQFDHVLNGSHLFRFARESAGRSRSPEAGRAYLLQINGIINEGRLRLDWLFSENIHRRATIESLVQDATEILQTLIAGCRSSNSQEFLPSDFPLLNLNQQQLDKIVSKIDKAKG